MADTVDGTMQTDSEQNLSECVDSDEVVPAMHPSFGRFYWVPRQFIHGDPGDVDASVDVTVSELSGDGEKTVSVAELQSFVPVDEEVVDVPETVAVRVLRLLLEDLRDGASNPTDTVYGERVVDIRYAMDSLVNNDVLDSTE